MTLKEKIQEDLKEALKKKEELTVSVLRMLNSAIHNREIEKKTKLRKGEEPEEKIAKEGQLTDEEITETIFSEIKKRKESILEFEKGKRLQPSLRPEKEKHIEDLVEKEKKEIEILEKYLPEQLPEEEIKKLAKEIIEKVGAEDIKDMGKVMGQIMPKVKGKTEGNVVGKIVKELLMSKSENKKVENNNQSN